MSDVSVGAQHCIALTSNGDVYSWGKNSACEVNDSGDFIPSPVLLQAVSGKGAMSVACGAFEVRVSFHFLIIFLL